MPLSMVRKTGIVAAAMLMIAMTAKAANNSEQVVFSTPGFLMDLSGNTHGTSTPFGFWLWCIAEAAENGGGPYQADNACQGSLYFYALDKHATHALGFSSEIDEGIYTMNVWEGRLPELLDGTIFGNADYFCTLTNTIPGGHGLGNSVQVDCTFSPALGGGTGSALVTNAVVNVTGP
jgi:hypothetical protein